MHVGLKVTLWIFAIAAIIGVALGGFWLVWLLWCFVLPQLWGNGPAALIRPGYWLFIGMWFLLGLVGRALFGSSKSKES